MRHALSLRARRKKPGQVSVEDPMGSLVEGMDCLELVPAVSLRAVLFNTLLADAESLYGHS